MLIRLVGGLGITPYTAGGKSGLDPDPAVGRGRLCDIKGVLLYLGL